MKVELIGCTTIDWNRYVSLTNKLIGRSPTRNLDSTNTPVGSLESFILSISEFKKEKGIFHPFYGQYINFIFLCEFDLRKYFNIFMFGSSIIIDMNEDNQNVFLWHNNLGSIILLLEKYLIVSSDLEVRQFFEDIMLILEKIGFKEVFSKYRRVKLMDGSLILERKS